MRTDRIRLGLLIGAAVILLVALVATACAPKPALAMACGTTDVPPIAVEQRLCSAQAAGVRWYFAPPADVSEPDEQPVIGQALDEDWWDPAERADLDDRPRTTPGPRSSSTTATPPTSSRRTAPPSAPARPTTSRTR